MVSAHHQHMIFFTQLDQQNPQQRTLFEIEWTAGLGGRQFQRPRLAHLQRQFPHIFINPQRLQGCVDDLARLPIPLA